MSEEEAGSWVTSMLWWSALGIFALLALAAIVFIITQRTLPVQLS
jgi:hypothetical protein